MKKSKLLTAAFISLTMLGSLPLTAEAACRSFNGVQISAPSGCNQNTRAWTNRGDLQAFLDSLKGSDCIVTSPSVRPPVPPTVELPDGNGNGDNQQGESENIPGDSEEQNKPELGDTETEDTKDEDTDTSEQLSYAEEVVRLVNQERTKNGLKPVTMVTNVQAAAQVRAKEIQTSFSHTRPDGRSYSTALQEQNVSNKGSGENIAWGQKSPEHVMSAWMNSDGHRKNILNSNYTTIGVGYYQGANGVNYWTQLFTY
ncbi:MAG: CAP domain-containing protein [Lachnospiraceae bacterium]